MSSELSGYLATFRSSEEAIGAERAFRISEAASSGLREELIPLPRGISSDCGFCLLLSLREGGIGGACAGEERIVGFLEERNCEGIYKVSESPIPGKRRKERNYERIYAR